MTGKPAGASLLKRPVVVASFAILVTSAACVGTGLGRSQEDAPEAPAVVAQAVPMPDKSVDWASLPLEELRSHAEANDVTAMEELARRLVQGVGVPKNQQAGADWLLRAAQAGSAQSAFNVAAMYERGVVLQRNAARAVAWYRRAVEGNLAIAKHNLALMLRDGKGTSRDGQEAVELLQSAARQGMAASMFSLGDTYERGDATPKDLAMAMAWYAIAAEFERQANRGAETALARTSATRAQALQHGLTQEDLQKAEQIGQSEFRRIVEAMRQPAKPPVRLAPVPPVEVAAVLPPPAPLRTGALPPLPPPDLDPKDWPKGSKDQVQIIQQALFDLKLLRDKPDGALGPLTRAAIRTYQRINAQRETGEPTKELYASLKEAAAHGDTAPPARPETRPEPPVAVAAAKPPDPIVIAAAETTAPPSSADSTKHMPVPPPPKPIQLAAAAPPPPPPTSADIVKATPVDPDAWPATATGQIKAIQALLREMRFYVKAPDGRMDPATRAAIRAYEGLAALKVTGQVSKELFNSLKEIQRLMKTAPGDGSR